MEILLEPTSNKLLVGLDDGVAALFSEVGTLKQHVYSKLSSQSFQLKIVVSNPSHHQRASKSATNSSSLTKPIQKSQVVLVDIPENLAENDSIVAEHGGSFEDSGRSDEEYSEDGSSSKEGGSETPQVRRSTRESSSANYLLTDRER
ncbi:hypothetical protein Tco_0744943 [Tanacetum coccineum]